MGGLTTSPREPESLVKPDGFSADDAAVGELVYEPTVIEEHARRLNRRARTMAVTSALIGSVVGGFFGSVPLTSLGSAWPIPAQFGFATLLAGVLLGLVLGYLVGDGRAFGCRLQAQSSLCQLHVERHLAALLVAVTPAPTRPREAPVIEAPVAAAPEVDSMSVAELAQLSESGLLI
jgi:hypothetical protein